MDNIKNSSNSDRDASPIHRLQLIHPNQVMEMSPWQTDFRQIERGKMETCVNARLGKLVTLLEMRMSRGVHQVGAAPVGTVSFGLPYSRTPYEWRRQEIEGPSVVLFGDGLEFDAYCQSAFNAVTLSVTTPVLEHLIDRFGFHTSLLHRIREPGAHIWYENWPGSSAAGNQARRLIQDASLPFGVSQQEDLILLLLATIDPDGRFKGAGKEANRSKILERAINIMSSNLADDLLIGNLCQQVGTSWATLERSFKEHFGIGPKAYSVRLRLGKVREELCKSPRSMAIADVANEFGFWHMGQFARDYRAVFGELPSQTQRYQRQMPVRGVLPPRCVHSDYQAGTQQA